MQIGIIVLVVLGVMIFSQVLMLASAQKKRHEELSARLDRVEKNLRG